MCEEHSERIARQPSPLPISIGERLDLVVDFKEGAGARIILSDDFVPLMQFRVSAISVKDDSVLLPSLRPIERLQESAAVKTRFLSLDEIDDKVQNLVKMPLNGKAWHAPVTENPALNSTEIWAFVNPTDDSHPSHLHLVKSQILDRRKIENFAYLSRQELRFKGMLTRIVVRFEGYAGRYVWHCHILEHEDNEMMRPFDVLPGG